MVTRRRTLGLALALLWLRPSPAAALTERVVVDAASGLAISGFDPVGYFLEGRPVAGLPEHEATAEGAVWRFGNAGNRAAFLSHPHIYAPRFGGHDPVQAARGFVARGDPGLFAVLRGRLYFFGSPENRDAFRQAPDGHVAEAERNWPRLAARLAR